MLQQVLVLQVHVVVLASLAQLLGLVDLTRSIQIKMKSVTSVICMEARGGSSIFRPQLYVELDSVVVGRKCIVFVHTMFF